QAAGGRPVTRPRLKCWRSRRCRCAEPAEREHGERSGGFDVKWAQNFWGRELLHLLTAHQGGGAGPGLAQTHPASRGGSMSENGITFPVSKCLLARGSWRTAEEKRQLATNLASGGGAWQTVNAYAPFARPHRAQDARSQ